MINCECTKFSVISGYLQNLTVIIQNPWPVEFELVFQPCFIIFIFVSVVFGIYCIILLMAERKTPVRYSFLKLSRSKTINFQFEAYYLADNLIKDNFNYLITVRTSNALESGTSSLVSFKILGTSYVSKVK